MSNPMEQLSSLLSDLAAGKGAIPLSISLKEDEEVKRLKEENMALQSRINGLQAELNRAEYLFRCESVLNNQLIDLCRENGIILDSSFFARPYSET